MRKLMKSKKGFTLVEIIVVLVIIAILAAAAIPAMLGFIDDAKGKALASEARSIYLAAQTIVAENYLADDADSDAYQDVVINVGDPDVTTDDITVLDRIGQLTNIDVDSADFGSVVIVAEDNIITSVALTRDGKVCTLNAGGQVTFADA